MIRQERCVQLGLDATIVQLWRLGATQQPEGMGARHQALRRQAAALVKAGRALCWRCGLPIHPGRASTLATMITTAASIEGQSTNTATDSAQHPEATGCEVNVGGCRSGWAPMIRRGGEAMKREAGGRFSLRG
jgi:hypothetical protein